MDWTSFGLGAVAKGIDYTVGYFQNKNSQRQAQANTRKNMQEQAELEQKGMYNSIAQSTSALRAAGLNPAVAANGGFAAQPSVSHSETALPFHGSNESILDFVNRSALQSSQIDLNEATAENARADASLKKQEVENKKQEIEESESRVSLNSEQQSMLKELTKKYGTEGLILGTQYSRMLTEDSVAHHALMDYCDRRLSAPNLSESERDFWNAFKAIGRRGKFDSGALMAMSLFANAWNSLEEYEKDIGARAILKQIQQMQLNDDDLLEVLSHMPAYQASLVFGQTAEALENAAFRKAYRKDLLPAELDKLEEDIRVQKHNDPAGMLKDGDYLGFGIYGSGQILRFLGSVYTARQFGKGSVAPSVGNLGKSSSGVSPKSPEPGKTSDGKTPPRLDTRSDTQVKQSVANSLGQKRADDLFNEFLKSNYHSSTGNNNFSEWLSKVKHIGR